jgi:hypothetical protein
MSDADLQRWEDIVEREMLGEQLSRDDEEFRASFEAEHPEQAHESNAWAGLLTSMREEGTAEGRAAMDALAQRVLVQRDLERDVVRPLRAPEKRTRPTAAIVATLAAAAAIAAIVVDRFDSNNETVVADRERAAPKPTPEPTPPPIPEQATLPAPSMADAGVLALAGEGLLVDGGMAVAGAEIRPGQRLDFGGPDQAATTTQGADACVVYDAPWITACFSRGSAVTFSTQAAVGERRLELERGRVLVTLDELPAGERFSVSTSKGTVAAVGTSFEVWIDEHGTVRASVLDGAVQVDDSTSDPRILGTGETTVLGSERIDRFGADALAWSRGHVQLSSIWRDAARGVLIVRPADDAELSPLTVDALPLGPAPVSLLASGGEHLLARAGTPRSVPVDIEPGGTHEITLEGDVEPRAKKPASKPTVKQLLAKISDARRAGRYKDAATTLEKLVRLYPGPDAQNARVELADLLRSKLGQPGRALKLYDAYLDRGGALSLEARYGRIRAFQGLGQSANERRAIEGFLAKHPKDWRSAGLRERAAGLD